MPLHYDLAQQPGFKVESITVKSNYGVYGRSTKPSGTHAGKVRVSMTNDNTFELFHQLPPELQTRIWEIVCCEPRIVEVHPVHVCVECFVPTRGVPKLLVVNVEGISFFPGSFVHLRSKTVPPLLSVCRESRRVARRMYSCTSLADPHVPRSLYFETDIDTFYYKYKSFFHSRRREGPLQIESLFTVLLGPEIKLQDYHNRTLSVPPRSPAGREMMRLRSFAINVLPLLRNQGLYMDKHRFDLDMLSRLFYFPLLEEIVLVIDDSDETSLDCHLQDRLNMVKVKELTEEVRTRFSDSLAGSFH